MNFEPGPICGDYDNNNQNPCDPKNILDTDSPTTAQLADAKNQAVCVHVRYVDDNAAESTRYEEHMSK